MDQRWPMTAPVTSRPEVVKFSPNAPGPTCADQFLGPPRGVLGGVGVHGLIGRAVMRDVADRVADQLFVAGEYRPGHRLLADAGAPDPPGPAAVQDLVRPGQVDRVQTGRHAPDGSRAWHNHDSRLTPRSGPAASPRGGDHHGRPSSEEPGRVVAGRVSRAGRLRIHRRTHRRAVAVRRRPRSSRCRSRICATPTPPLKISPTADRLRPPRPRTEPTDLPRLAAATQRRPAPRPPAPPAGPGRAAAGRPDRARQPAERPLVHHPQPRHDRRVRAARPAGDLPFSTSRRPDAVAAGLAAPAGRRAAPPRPTRRRTMPWRGWSNGRWCGARREALQLAAGVREQLGAYPLGPRCADGRTARIRRRRRPRTRPRRASAWRRLRKPAPRQAIVDELADPARRDEAAQRGQRRGARHPEPAQPGSAGGPAAGHVQLAAPPGENGRTRSPSSIMRGLLVLAGGHTAELPRELGRQLRGERASGLDPAAAARSAGRPARRPRHRRHRVGGRPRTRPSGRRAGHVLVGRSAGPAALRRAWACATCAARPRRSRWRSR